MKDHAHLIWGLLLGAIAALGAIKTIVELSAGSEFSLQRVAFFIGTAAVSIYLSAGMAAFATGALVTLIGFLIGHDSAQKYLMIPILVITLAGGFLFVAYAATVFNFGYQQLDPILRGILALIGLVAIAGTIYMFRKT